MSRSEATERSRRWLEEQLETLGSLRNATARDSTFKSWRQGTLTILQRIWPGEATRSEKFRRIYFTPPGSRPEPGQMRGVYSRGCVEASQYLRALIAEIDADGVTEAESPVERDLSLPQGEDDFPTVELPGVDVRAVGGPDTGDNDIVLELGGPSPESSLAAEPRAEDSGVPPTLKVEVKASQPEPPAAEDLPPTLQLPPEVVAPQILSEASATPPALVPRTRSGRPSKASRRGGMKQRLKDMLGLSHFTAPVPEESPSMPIESAENGVFTTKPSKKQQNKGLVSIESLISPEFRNAPADEAPAMPPASEQPIESPVPLPSDPNHDDQQIDPDAFARATQDFLKNSPVLGLVGKPVKRQKDECDLLDPDAVAIFTLASDVSRLGVPEGRRAAARALLLDLARRVEERDADWAILRSTVNFAMEFPELARRLMPVLLPWFDRAA